MKGQWGPLYWTSPKRRKVRRYDPPGRRGTGLRLKNDGGVNPGRLKGRATLNDAAGAEPRRSPLAEELPVAVPGLEPVVEALQAEELVRGVIVLVDGREGEEHRLGCDGVAEDEADGHCGAHPHPERALAIDLLQHFFGQRQVRMLVGDRISLCAGTRFDL